MNLSIVNLLDKKLIRKALFAVLFVGLYFIVVREIRISLNTFFYELITDIEISSNLNVVKFPTRLWIYDYSFEFAKTYTFRFAFGYYYLLGMTGLLFFSFDKRSFSYLTITHLLLTIVSLIATLIGLIRFNSFLILSDIISRYLIPSISLGIVAISPILVQKTNKGKTEYQD